MDSGASMEPALSKTQQMELAKLLLDCTSMSDHNSRSLIIQMLDHHIGNYIRRDNHALVDVVNIVRACNDHIGGMKNLLEIIEQFDGQSFSLHAVKRFMENAAKTPVPHIRPSKPTPNKSSSLGKSDELPEPGRAEGVIEDKDKLPLFRPWRPWGDHPVIVGLLVFIAVVTFIMTVVLPEFDNTAATYKGRVLNTVTGLPVSGAKVTLDVGGETPKIVFTDDEGTYNFVLSLPDNANGQIRVDKDGFAPYSRNLSLTQQQPQLEEIRLTPAGGSLYQLAPR